MIMDKYKAKVPKSSMGHRLTAEDRDFLTKITQAMFLNPFEENLNLLKKLVPDFSQEQFRKEHFLWTLRPPLNEYLARMDQRGFSRIQSIRKEDRGLMENVFLLQTYLRYVPDIDNLVQTQLANRGKSVGAHFGKEVVNQLQKRGFSEEKSLNSFSLFFQLRRAYFFIEQSLLGYSPCMQKLRHKLWQSVFTFDVRNYSQYLTNRMEDFSTLILGETGTGKGSAASAIGRSGYIPFDLDKGQFSRNFNDLFLPINLSQFSEGLIESELFGHKKGSFTGAMEDHKGIFELCDTHGSLLLDEIGDLSVPIQIKLLQVLQERVFSPVGSHERKRFDGRVIVATNHSIHNLRKEGRFRDDFFYRLCSDVITVPTLRQRIAELPSELELLVHSLVQRMTSKEIPRMTDMILEVLKRDLPAEYSWPGNVRELEQAVRRILLTQNYKGDLITLGLNREEELIQKIQSGTLEARELLSRYCALLFRHFGTYEEVARRTKLDRRTVKRYVDSAP
jgi:DNA-binding NtrC family response regulator